MAQLPDGEQIFLDHVAHFTPSLDEAAKALSAIGFRITPFTAQRNRTEAGLVASGTANRCVMLREGYLEFLTAVSDTALARQLHAATARHVGLHLIAFAVADGEAARRRLSEGGFHPGEPVALTRPVETEDGAGDEARFTVIRVPPEAMPEGRVQVLAHHTEPAVWQERWLAHDNGVRSLGAVLIAVADPDEAASRFGRFCGRPHERRGERRVLRLDRGACVLIAHDELASVAPWARPRVGAPWIVSTALGSDDPALTEDRFAAGGIAPPLAISGGKVYALPPELGGFMTVSPYGAAPDWVG